MCQKITLNVNNQTTHVYIWMKCLVEVPNNEILSANTSATATEVTHGHIMY